VAVPKRRTSKSRRDMRRAQNKLIVPQLVPCPQCRELKATHRACLVCGYYKDRAALKVN